MLPTQTPTEKTVLYFSDLPTNLIQSDLEMFLSKYQDSVIAQKIKNAYKFRAKAKKYRTSYAIECKSNIQNL